MENIKGIDILVKIGGSVLGGQQGATLNRSAEAIETTSKDSNGWRERVAGIKEWSIEAEGLMITDDQAYQKLEDAFMHNQKVSVSLVTPSGLKYEGDAVITDFPVEAGFEDVATYSVTLEGTGSLNNSVAV